MDESFWSNILQLKILLQPYCGALDKMQTDKARLFDIILSFGYFIKIWEKYTNRVLAESMITRLENR